MGGMPAQGAAAPEGGMLSAARWDYRRSLLLVVVGVVLLVVTLAVSLGISSMGGQAASYGTGLALDIASTAGGMLILLGGTVAYYHHAFLRQFGGGA